MRLRVDLLPRGDYPDVAVVIDVLRATTTAVAFLEAGAEALWLTPDPEAALALREEHGALLAGERGGWALPGYDFGNSPAEAAESRCAGRVVAMNTTNGTAAARQAAQSAQHVLLASLTNAHAAARRAQALASEEIALVCAGTDGRVGLEDVYAAGVLAEYLLALGDFSLDDGARLALLARRSSGDPLQALRGSAHGATLERLGLGEDNTYAAGLSISRVVPALLSPPPPGTPPEMLVFMPA